MSRRDYHKRVEVQSRTVLTDDNRAWVIGKAKTHKLSRTAVINQAIRYTSTHMPMLDWIALGQATKSAAREATAMRRAMRAARSPKKPVSGSSIRPDFESVELRSCLIRGMRPPKTAA